MNKRSGLPVTADVCRTRAFLEGGNLTGHRPWLTALLPDYNTVAGPFGGMLFEASKIEPLTMSARGTGHLIRGIAPNLFRIIPTSPLSLSRTFYRAARRLRDDGSIASGHGLSFIF